MTLHEILSIINIAFRFSSILPHLKNLIPEWKMKILTKVILVLMALQVSFALEVSPRDVRAHVIESFRPFHEAHIVINTEREDIIISKEVICSNFLFECSDKSEYEVLQGFVDVINSIRDRAYKAWSDMTIDKRCFASKSYEKQSIFNCIK